MLTVLSSLSKLRLLVVFMALGLVVCTSSTHAQKTAQKDTANYRTQEVVVNATRADAITSPVTFNEINRSAILQKHTVGDLPQLLSDLPSSVFYSENANGIGYSYLTMRGFDQRRIAVLVNGIPQNDPEDHNVYWIDFPDLVASADNIQVQRGAGLVNYGAAAIGGSININTVNIMQRKFARVTSGIGLQEHAAPGLNAALDERSTLATSKASFEYCSGLTDDHFAFYTRISQIQSRGYRDNSWAELNSFFVSAGRFDDNVSVQVNVFGGPISDGLAYTGLPKSYISDPALRRLNFNYWEYNATGDTVGYAAPRRQSEQEQFSQPHVEVLGSVALSSSITLSSTLFLYTGRGYFDYDGSWADARTLRLTSRYGGSDSISSPGNSLIRAWVSNRQLGWIPNLRIRHTDGELLVGAEIRSHRSEHWGNIAYAEQLPSGFDPDFRIYSYNGERDINSVFAREQYRISDRLTASVDCQYVHTTYGVSNERQGLVATSYLSNSGASVGNGGQIFSLAYNFFNPRLGLMWQASDKHSFYFSAAQTSREPRMANLYSIDGLDTNAIPFFARDSASGRFDFSKPLVKPESMLDLELGWKAQLTDLQLAVTFYYMDFKDELVKNGRRDIFGNPITGNAPRTRHMGLEAQASWLAWQASNSSLSFSANATLSRNRIIEYSYAASTSTFDLANNPVSGFPDVMANLQTMFKIDNASINLTVKSIGTMYSDNFGTRLKEYRALSPGDISYNDNVIDPVVVLNASLQYEFHNIFSLNTLRLRVSCNNLTNKLYAAGANGAEFYPAAERNWFFGLDIEP